MSNTARSDDPLDALVRRAKDQIVFDRSRSSNLLGVPVAALIVWALSNQVQAWLLASWFAAKSSVTLLRAFITWRHGRAPAERRGRLSDAFVVAIAADGAVFGMLGTLLLPTGDRALAATMIATLMGIAAIGLVVLAPSYRAVLALTVPTLLPAMLWQFAQGDQLAVYTACGLAVFLGLVVVEGRRAAEHTTAMLRLRFEMVDLAAQRQQALAQAERSNAVKSQFLATMSHEMRTPLHGLLGVTRLLRRELGTARHEVQAQRLEVVERAGDHLLGIINDVLDQSRIESGRLVLVRKAFEVGALVDSVLDLIHPAALDKGLALRRDVALALPRHAEGDADRLRQILLNLLGNAAKFTERGHIGLRVCESAPGRLAFEVSDSGPGIGEADRERIFRPFEQLDGSYGRRHGGTGLGLAISRDLAHAMGGTLHCHAAPGGGALFRLELPLPRMAPLPLPVPAAPAPPAALRGRVLLVEDNPVNALVAEAALQRLGLAVEVVDNGERAVTRLADERFDLVLMDCQMPVIDGFEATARIRAHERVANLPPVTIVALTANALYGDRERSLAAGMNDHLAKPFRDEDLAAVLARHLPAPSEPALQA